VRIEFIAGALQEKLNAEKQKPGLEPGFACEVRNKRLSVTLAAALATTVAAATTAATASRTTWATETTATTRATRRTIATGRRRTRFIDDERTPFERFAIHASDCGLRALIGGHGNERKAAHTPGFAIHR
jgi:hypothetical protein